MAETCSTAEAGAAASANPKAEQRMIANRRLIGNRWEVGLRYMVSSARKNPHSVLLNDPSGPPERRHEDNEKREKFEPTQ